MEGLHIEKLSANARGITYLSKVSLSVEAGEAFALVGKGGDRRLLMRIVRECMREKINFIENEDVIARVHSGSSTLVIEGDNLFNFMSLKQYMLYTAGAIKMTKIEKLDRIAECLDLVGLAEKWKHKISLLSRTEKCLLSIANGLFSKPEVLLLCLDEIQYTRETAVRLNEVIKRLKGLGMTILASVNDSRLIEDGFDRIGLMNEGKLIETGTAEDIIAKYSYCVYSVKSDGANIKKLAEKFSELKSIFKVQPKGGKLYLYSLDKEKTGREMLEAIGEGNKIEELRMVSPSLKDALTRAWDKRSV